MNLKNRRTRASATSQSRRKPNLRRKPHKATIITPEAKKIEAPKELSIAKDRYYWEKQKLFDVLVRYAKSQGIDVLIMWEPRRDYSATGVRVIDNRFTSNGAIGSRTACVFCGRGPVKRSEKHTMDGFVADRQCYREMFQDRGTVYLPPAAYRPAMIIHMANVPDSIDNNILNLAFGIACHELGFTLPVPSSNEWKKQTEESAKRLVRHLAFAEMALGPRPENLDQKSSLKSSQKE